MDPEGYVPYRLVRIRGVFQVGVGKALQLQDGGRSVELHQPEGEVSTAAEREARRSAVFRISSSIGMPRARRRWARLAASRTSKPTSRSLSTSRNTFAGGAAIITPPAPMNPNPPKR